MEWLAQGSDVLYPSAYFYEYVDKDRRPALVDGAVHMSRVWLNITGEPHKPIYFYTTTTLNNHPSPMPYYNDVRFIYVGVMMPAAVNETRAIPQILLWILHKWFVLVGIITEFPLRGKTPVEIYEL